MSFFSAKCPECKANLDIVEGKDVIKCNYCGSSIIVADLSEFKNLPNRRNLIKLGRSYIQTGNYQEAIKEFDKALEIDPEYNYAWFGRGMAISYTSTLQNCKINEVIKNFKKAIELTNIIEKDSFSEEVLDCLIQVLINYHSSALIINTLNQKSFSYKYRDEFERNILNFCISYKIEVSKYKDEITEVCKDNIFFKNCEKYWLDYLQQLNPKMFEEVYYIIMERKREKEEKIYKQMEINNKKREQINKDLMNKYIVFFSSIGLLISFIISIFLHISMELGLFAFILLTLIITFIFGFIGFQHAKSTIRSNE